MSRGKITRYGAPHCPSEFDIEELTQIAQRRRPGPVTAPARRPVTARH
ncbi:hypothetical protein ACWD1Y_32545 [Streptomyces sp. NPDC002814]